MARSSNRLLLNISDFICTFGFLPGLLFQVEPFPGRVVGLTLLSGDSLWPRDEKSSTSLEAPREEEPACTQPGSRSLRGESYAMY